MPDSENEKIAGWLGWTRSLRSIESTEPNSVVEVWQDSKGQWIPNGMPDFFTDEAANAMVLEKMRHSLLVSDWPGCKGWRVDLGVQYQNGPPIAPTHMDRKTAVVLACLALIEGGKR